MTRAEVVANMVGTDEARVRVGSRGVRTAHFIRVNGPSFGDGSGDSRRDAWHKVPRHWLVTRVSVISDLRKLREKGEKKTRGGAG
jgi:hypothetical protein